MMRESLSLGCLVVLAALSMPSIVAQAHDDEAGSRIEPQVPAQDRAVGNEIHVLFQRGVVMLHARRYERAFDAFHQVLRLQPRLPEAHVNAGFALVGLDRHAQAADFFHQATLLRSERANAYYGLAVALEAMGDLPGALGAMRTFVHLAPPGDRFLPRARAALWEWERDRPERDAVGVGPGTGVEDGPATTDGSRPVAD